MRAWKWSIIDRYVDALDDVIDVGCGDLSFWEGRDCRRYVGLDLSKSVLRANRRRRPRWSFICADAAKPLRARAMIVLCMDVLFHVLDESQYSAILRNLSAYTDRWLFVGTWIRNPVAPRWTHVRSALPTRGCVASAALLVAHPLQLFRSTMRRLSFGLHEQYHGPGASFNVLLETGLRLVAVHPSPFDDGINALYVFHRKA